MSKYSSFSDQELVALLREGDHAAYTEIYKRYWALLYRNARKMLHDEQETTDVVQEVFTLLWEKAPKLYLDHSLSAYLYSSVRNRIINIINRQKLKVNYVSSLTAFLISGSSITDDTIRERELALQIEKEIALLPEKMRKIFELSRKAHLSYKEIAEKIDISEGTVKKQVYNAIKILRLKLGAFIFLVLAAILLQFGQKEEKKASLFLKKTSITYFHLPL